MNQYETEWIGETNQEESSEKEFKIDYDKLALHTKLGEPIIKRINEAEKELKQLKKDSIQLTREIKKIESDIKVYQIGGASVVGLVMVILLFKLIKYLNKE